MRYRLFSVVAALARSSAAQADAIISGTVTGTITGGFDGGPNGANDNQDLFGGGNLYGVTVNLFFSYDLTALSVAAMDGTNGSSSTVDATDQGYLDFANDGAVAESVTIGGTMYATNSSEGNPAAPAQSGLANCLTAQCITDQLNVEVAPSFTCARSDGPGDKRSILWNDRHPDWAAGQSDLASEFLCVGCQRSTNYRQWEQWRRIKYIRHD
jgi:hypothetical protein